MATIKSAARAPGQRPIVMIPPERIFSDPVASDWLKQALKSALLRDPVDALNDAVTLVGALKHRLEAVLSAPHAFFEGNRR